MLNTETQMLITKAIGIATEMNPQDTDSTWLEDVAV